MLNVLNRVSDQLMARKWLVLVGYMLVSLLCYFSVLDGDFLFDDEHFIQKNKYIHDLNISKIYTTSVTEGAEIKGNFYRPNQQFIFGLLYQIVGEETALPYHLIGIFLHGFNAYLFFLILFELNKRNTFIVLLSPLLFLIHPIQSEAVAYISGLADPLVGFFILLGIRSFQKLIRFNGKHAYLWLFAAIFCQILASFSKENNVVITALFVLFALFYNRIEKYKLTTPSFIGLTISIVLSGVFVYAKMTVLDFTGAGGLTGENNIYTQKLWVRLATFLNIFPAYLKMFFLPVKLNYEKPYTGYIDFFTKETIFSYLYLAVWIYSIVKMRKIPFIFLGLTLFNIAMIPYIGIIPLNAMYLEHWMYLPMLGWALAFIALLSSFKKNLMMPIFITALFVLCIYRTYLRAEEWGDIEKFYLNELKYGDSARICNNLAMYYSDKGNDAKAIKFYNKSIKTNDSFPQPHHNLGNIYWEQGNKEMALSEWYKALQIDPNFIYTWSKVYGVAASRNPKLAEELYNVIKTLEGGKGTVNREYVNSVFSRLLK